METRNAPSKIAPSSNTKDKGLHFRLDFLLTSDLAAHMRPAKSNKKNHRPTRNVKARPQHRPQAAQHVRHHRAEGRSGEDIDHDKTSPRKASPQKPEFDRSFTAASTDASLKALSPTVRAMQARARLQAYEQHRQRSDLASLLRLEAAYQASCYKAALLDRLSLLALERATAPTKADDEHYTPHTISTNELDAFATLDSKPTASGSEADIESNTDSFVFVSSNPTQQSSDDVFAASPQIKFIMPTLSYGQDSEEGSESSGRPLKRIEEESTGSLSSPRPRSTPSRRLVHPSLRPARGSESLQMTQQGSLLARLQDIETKEPKGAVTQSWLEEQIADAMGNEFRSPEKTISPRKTVSPQKTPRSRKQRDETEDFEIVEKMEAVELSEDDGYKGDEEDAKSEESFAVIGDSDSEEDWESEDDEKMDEDDDGWFDVVTESMVKGTA